MRLQLGYVTCQYSDLIWSSWSEVKDLDLI